MHGSLLRLFGRRRRRHRSLVFYQNKRDRRLFIVMSSYTNKRTTRSQKGRRPLKKNVSKWEKIVALVGGMEWRQTSFELDLIWNMKHRQLSEGSICSVFLLLYRLCPPLSCTVSCDVSPLWRQSSLKDRPLWDGQEPGIIMLYTRKRKEWSFRLSSFFWGFSHFSSLMVFVSLFGVRVERWWWFGFGPSSRKRRRLRRRRAAAIGQRWSHSVIERKRTRWGRREPIPFMTCPTNQRGSRCTERETDPNKTTYHEPHRKKSQWLLSFSLYYLVLRGEPLFSFFNTHGTIV